MDGAGRGLAALRQFVRLRAPVEACDFCSLALAGRHDHLIDPERRELHCVCGACAVLFGEQTRYRRVGRSVINLPDFRLSEAQWEMLGVPIRLAFFFRSSASERIVAIYPSPAGPTESFASEEGWSAIVEENPALAEMAADTEALLVNRVGEARDHLIAPIDECFRLSGLIRTQWRGFSGGREVWREIEGFFAELKGRGGKG